MLSLFDQVASYRVKIDENFAKYSFKSKAKNKCFLVLIDVQCTCIGLQKSIIELRHFQVDPSLQIDATISLDLCVWISWFFMLCNPVSLCVLYWVFLCVILCVCVLARWCVWHCAGPRSCLQLLQSSPTSVLAGIYI